MIKGTDLYMGGSAWITQGNQPNHMNPSSPSCGQRDLTTEEGSEREPAGQQPRRTESVIASFEDGGRGL